MLFALKPTNDGRPGIALLARGSDLRSSTIIDTPPNGAEAFFRPDVIWPPPSL